ncbi:uncharacterized protein LOC131080009 [Cryptomeria japonica]|uniref:uncharacterized protein LOC131080009 n=1 Tax=Cryptomeria japonica TaxID=3369 RepID=UPI0027D9EB00|nr:uncharacterized protein LOC131080009 [Cryptomeria japonica]XP_057874047.2 uncharacterized protein LOC131080009 [Cryptomeria japonica]
MSGDWQDSGWVCGGGGPVNLCRVASFVGDRDRRGKGKGKSRGGSYSPSKGSKILKPERWRAAFDSEGKPVGFTKALKTIVLGGVDPSVRAEVWEFLLGCYALSSTAEYRQHLRMARRERYRELIEQCQMMHSSIGTGSLAYTIGSKVMDVRIMSKDSAKKQAKLGVKRITEEAKSKLESSHGLQPNERFEVSYANENDRPSSPDSHDFGSARENTDDAALNSFYSISSTGLDSGVVSESEREDNGRIYLRQDSSDFPPLPVTNLFERSENAGEGSSGNEAISPREQATGNSYDSSQINGEKGDFLLEDAIHKFENGDKIAAENVELAQENHISSSEERRDYKDKFTLAKAMVQEQESGINESKEQSESADRMKMSDASEPTDTPLINPVVALGVDVNEDRVADWLWTLHRIVVDVVRTDRHLEFYGDTKNMARMSDILAVYAWVDPRTGYCQGMSDLLSPFIILFEDDADAFWCFESLLRRMRPNFQMEGPVGVMKQLENLGRILQCTDLQLFKHLALVGADSLLFAFRMLLVLFRRELSFNDALCMWEMMWAADFDEAMAWALENNCLEALVLRLPKTLSRGSHVECDEGTPRSKSNKLEQNHVEIHVSGHDDARSLSRSPFCGLGAGNFWPKQDRQQILSMSSLLKKDPDDELSVFCVAAILVLNRSKFIKEINSMDDAIKMFNDMQFEIKVKSCIHMAIKLRKKYARKLASQARRGKLSPKQSS